MSGIDHVCNPISVTLLSYIANIGAPQPLFHGLMKHYTSYMGGEGVSSLKYNLTVCIISLIGGGGGVAPKSREDLYVQFS